MCVPCNVPLTVVKPFKVLPIVSNRKQCVRVTTEKIIGKKNRFRCCQKFERQLWIGKIELDTRKISSKFNNK